jgi:hypothetical protein
MNKIFTNEPVPFYLEIPGFYTDRECDLIHYQYMTLPTETINNESRQCIRRTKIDHTFADLLYKEIEHHIPSHLAYGTGYQYRSGVNAMFRHCITSTGQVLLHTSPNSISNSNHISTEVSVHPVVTE